MHLIEDVRLIGGPLPVLEKMGWRKKMISFLYVVIKGIKNHPMVDQKYLSDTRQ